MKKSARILCVLMVLALFMPFAAENASVIRSFSVYAEEVDGAVTEEVLQPPLENEMAYDNVIEDFTPPEYEPIFTFPENMVGIYLTPTVDFAANPAASGEELTAEINAVLDRAAALKANTVFFNTNVNGQNFYSTDINQTVERSVIEYAIEAAKQKGFFVYLTFDINNALAGINEENMQERIDMLALRAHAFTVKYPVDGIVLDGYYSSKNKQSFSDYMLDGSGIGYDNWLLDNGAYVFSLVSDAVRRTNNTVPVGISLKDVWANYTTVENGSETADSFQALTDGYADTLSYIRSGYADFIVLRAEGSLSNTSLPFSKLAGWWASHAVEADIPLYINHVNEQIGTEAVGWLSPDELAKQVLEARNIAGYKGSAFNSLAALENNYDSSTTVLMKTFEGTVDVEGLDKELDITVPKQTVFTTEEPMQKFQGSFDPNFDVYFNNQKIQLNEAGYFYYDMDLEEGVNYFQIRSKAKTINYQITRNVVVLKSMEPTGSMQVEGGTQIAVSCIAYIGSTVTATIGGKTIQLSPVSGQVDEIDPNSNYTKYTGTYTVPAGKVGKEQNLGNIQIYGVYKSKNGTKKFTGSLTGATVIINALAESQNDFAGSLLEVKSNNTMVYSASTTDSVPTPDMARLPAGTLDYLTKKVTYGSTSYYITNSGKRLKTSAVNVLANRPLGANPLSVVSVGKDGTDTIIKMQMAAKSPFSISYNNAGYTSGDNGNYYVADFNASSVSITFDYVTSLKTGALSFPSSAMFTSGAWDTVTVKGLTKYRLTLKLRQNGIYSGVGTSYDGEGNLVFRFNGYRQGLKGAVIVIDPGHGYTGKSAFDPGAIGHVKEQSVNLAVSKLLESQLANEGATVIRLKTESQAYDTYQRSDVARQHNPDMYISLHCNSASSAAAGQETYYFTPFSKPLAASINNSLSSYFSKNVYGGASHNRGSKYNYFVVTTQQEFPSVLIEMAFVSNYNDAMALANTSHQSGIASAITAGVKNYFARSSYSPAGSGMGTVAGGGTVPAGDAAVTTQDMLTTEPPQETTSVPAPDSTNPANGFDTTTVAPVNPDAPQTVPSGKTEFDFLLEQWGITTQAT